MLVFLLSHFYIQAWDGDPSWAISWRGKGTENIFLRMQQLIIGFGIGAWIWWEGDVKERAGLQEKAGQDHCGKEKDCQGRSHLFCWHCCQGVGTLHLIPSLQGAWMPLILMSLKCSHLLNFHIVCLPGGRTSRHWSLMCGSLRWKSCREGHRARSKHQLMATDSTSVPSCSSDWWNVIYFAVSKKRRGGSLTYIMKCSSTEKVWGNNLLFCCKMNHKSDAAKLFCIRENFDFKTWFLAVSTLFSWKPSFNALSFFSSSFFKFTFSSLRASISWR